jgi:PAS domain S-box-containing protein
MRKHYLMTRAIGIAILFGLGFWLLDSTIHLFYFGQNLRFMIFERPDTLLDALLLKVSPYMLFVRLSFLVACVAGGVLARVYVGRHRQSQAALRVEEAAARESEECYRTLADNATDMISRHTLEGVYLYASPACRRMLGYEPDELVGEGAYDFLHSDDLAAIRASQVAILEQPVVHTVRYRMRHKDGSYLWVETASHALRNAETGEVEEILAITRDITERRREEEALRESEDRLRRVIQDMPVMLNAMDEDGQFMAWNRECERVTGYSAEEIIGNPRAVEMLYPDPAYRQQVLEEWVERGGDFRNWEMELTGKGGSTRIVSWTNVSDRFLIPGWASWSVGVDVTERVHAEVTRAQTEKTLRALTSRYEAILAAVPDIIMEVDTDKVYTWANQAGLGFFGEGVLGKDAAYYFVGEQDTYGVVQSLFDGDENVVYIESWQRRRDGEERLLAWWCRVLKDVEGNVTGALSTARDITERKRIEEALRDSESLLNEVGRIAKIGGWEMDLVTRKAKWTRGTYDIIEIDYGDPIPGPDEHVDYYLPEYRPMVQGAMDKLIEQDLPFDFEAKAQTAKGNIRWVRAIGRGVRKDGACIKAFGTIQDVTERKEREEEYKKLVDGMNDSAYVIDFDAKFVEVNDTAVGFLGYSREELFSMGPEDIDPLKDAEEIKHLVEGMKAGEKQVFETQHMTKGGDTIPVEVSSSLVSYQGKPAILSIARDITERKRAAAEVHSLAKFPGENPNPVLRVSADGTILYANESSQLLLSTWERQVGQPLLDEWREFTLNVLNSGSREDAEVEDGDRILSLTFAPVMDQGYVNVYGFDITGRKRAEEELRRHREHLEELVAARTAELDKRIAESEGLNRAMTNLLEDLQAANCNLEEATQKLEEANAELESFAYSVSHDLRAPLRAVDGFSRILQGEYAPELSPEARRYLDLVRDNARQMGQLIDDLLAFSRLSRKPLTKHSVSPADLARQVLEDLRQEQEGRQVEIIIDDLPTCQADPSLLKQVYVNLLSNALKYTRKREVTRIQVGYQVQDNQPVYYVKDNGVGFDMRYADKLFGVFQRLHRAEEYEGTGVGLAIVQRIIRRHGGHIWADAGVDEGAAFYFTI